MTSQFGTLKWYSFKRGYGFVHSDDGDVRIHAVTVSSRDVYDFIFRNRMRRREVGIVIEYHATKTPQGLRATWWRPTE